MGVLGSLLVATMDRPVVDHGDRALLIGGLAGRFDRRQPTT